MLSIPQNMKSVSPSIRASWYGLCLAALGIAIFAVQRVIFEYPTAAEQRALVPVSTVWGMHACLVIGLTGFVALLPQLVRFLGRKHLLTGLSLAVLGYFACGLAPKTHRIFYDEHIYMQIGQTIAHTGRAEYASYARVEYGDFSIFDAWVNKQPNGHPYLLSWVYRLAGASEDVSFVIGRVVVGLTACALYFALILAPWSLPPLTPIAVPLCFIFTPLVLWWGRTVSAEPTAAATTVACFFAVCLHARWRDSDTNESSPLSGAVLAATAAFATYFRPESLLVYPMAATLLLASNRRFLEDRTTWAALALSLALITPNLLHLWSVRTEDWGATDGRRFDLDFLAKNLSSNAGYFVQGKWFPLAGTALALVGAGWLAVRNRWLAAGAGVWLAFSWGIFVLFYAGGYYYGASSRYAVVSAAPVALFMGIGAAALGVIFRRRPIVISGIGVVVILNWVAAMHFVPTLGRESNEARADIAFASETAAKLPSGSLVISTDPCVWDLLGRNAAQLPSVEGMVRTQMRELVRQYPGGIYLHWDYWMNTQPQFATIWRQLVFDTHATVFARGNAEAVKFALFRLDTPYAREALGGTAIIEGPQIDLDKVIADTPTNTIPPNTDNQAQIEAAAQTTVEDKR